MSNPNKTNHGLRPFWSKRKAQNSHECCRPDLEPGEIVSGRTDNCRWCNPHRFCQNPAHKSREGLQPRIADCKHCSGRPAKKDVCSHHMQTCKDPLCQGCQRQARCPLGCGVKTPEAQKMQDSKRPMQVTESEVVKRPCGNGRMANETHTNCKGVQDGESAPGRKTDCRHCASHKFCQDSTHTTREGTQPRKADCKRCQKQARDELSALRAKPISSSFLAGQAGV